LSLFFLPEQPEGGVTCACIVGTSLHTPYILIAKSAPRRLIGSGRVSAALWVDGGRCADARARDASRALFPRSIFHGFSLRACAGELCRVRRAVAPQPCAPRSAYSFGLTAYFFFQDNTWSEFRSIRLVHVFLKQKKQTSAGPGGPDL